MSRVSEVVDYCYNDLLLVVEEVEEKRKKSNRRAFVISGVVSSIVFVIVALFVLMDGNSVEEDLDEALLVGITFYVFIYYFVYYIVAIFTRSEYMDAFKEKIANPIIKYISPRLSYIDRGRMSLAAVNRSKIIEERRIDSYSNSHYLSGDVVGIKIELGDVKIEEKHEYEERVGENETRTRTEYETIFKGVFLRAESPKRIDGYVLVLRDRIEGALSSIFRKTFSYNSLRLERIKLDSPEFEKHFFTYGSDQIESRYILSHSMMERILRFRKKVGHGISLSFTEGDVFLAVHDVELFLEPPIYRSLLNREVMEKYIGSVFFLVGVIAVGFVEELKLDQKLWAKS